MTPNAHLAPFVLLGRTRKVDHKPRQRLLQGCGPDLKLKDRIKKSMRIQAHCVKKKITHGNSYFTHIFGSLDRPLGVGKGRKTLWRWSGKAPEISKLDTVEWKSGRCDGRRKGRLGLHWQAPTWKSNPHGHEHIAVLVFGFRVLRAHLAGGPGFWFMRYISLRVRTPSEAKAEAREPQDRNLESRPGRRRYRTEHRSTGLYRYSAGRSWDGWWR